MRLFGITIFSSKKAYDLTIDSTYHEISFEEIINRFSSYYKAYKNLTKETAKTAQAKVSFDNTKLKKHLPNFSYTPLQNSIERICAELKQIHNL